MAKQYLLLILTAFSFTLLKAQNYTLLGTASTMSGCNCFQLTPDAGNQAGAIFQNNTINLNNSFDFTFNVFLGCNGSNGADGMVFVLTSNPNGMGQPGEAMGYASGGNQPYSLAVEFDTWQNGSPANDPGSDHIGINSGGLYNHNVAPAVSALTSGGNIDDCGWHTVRVVWDVNTNTFTVYFDGVIRQQIVIPNMVNQFFGGNPIVNWGWSGATGGGSNLQQVCVQNTSNWVAGVNYQSCNTTMQFSDVSTSSLGSVASWAWNFGDGGTSTLQNPTHTYAANGTYTVTLTVTDITGCTNTFSHPVTINPPITLSPNIQQPPCNGGSNGSITLTPSGGFGPAAGYGGYTYQWSTGFSGATAVGVSAGTYTVTATDGVCTTTAQYNVNQPPPLTATTSSTNAPCGGNGTATIVISGGTPPYNNVTWAGFPGYTVSLPAGTWIANFNDANGCSALLQYTTTISQLPCGVNSSTTSTNVTCFGGNNGSITLTVTGITGTPNVAWSNGGSGFTISGLIAGTYTYNYTDSDPAHAFSGTVIITQPGAAMVASMSTVNTSCAGVNNGQAIASVPSGGTSPYNYTWSNGAPNNPVANNLAPGPISVTVTGANGCTATASGVVSNPPTLTVSITAINDSCFQSNTGSATANPSGGTPPYTYYWSNISSAQTNLGLGMGTYTLTVTDDNGCTVTGSVSINQPPAFTHTISSQNINCFGNSTGSITVTPNGGTPAYTYTWSPATASGNNPQNLAAGLYNVTITDANQCQRTDAVTITQPATALSATSSHTNVTCFGANNGSITLTVGGGSPPYTFQGNPVPPGTTTLPNLPPNTYAGNLTDANGCSVALSETITEPTQISVTETHVDVSCNAGTNGSIDITVTGGTTPYTYLWNDGNTNQDRTGLSNGTYILTATDFNSCTATISVTINQPTALSISETHANVLCNGNSTGSVDITVSGGTPNYTYLWNDGNTNEDRTNIPAASYSVTATDANTCTISTSVTITQPAALTATSSHTNVTCFGANNGSITLTVGGGSPPYTFQGNPVPPGTTTLPNLPPNTYAGNLTDANGCSVALSETITEPALLSLTETHVNVSCNAGTNGSIDITVTGGTTPYTYLWNDGNTNQDRTGLSNGTYILTTTDFNSCTATISVTINQPTALSISETHADVLCNGNSTGSIDITVSGGTPNYTYLWNDGNTNEDRTNIPAASYSVTATDANTCTISTSVTITQPAALTATSSHTNVTCFGANNGSITLTVGGGSPPYTFQGNPVPPGTTTLPNLPPNTYAGNLTDANGCSVALSETITEPTQISVTETHVDATCNGASNGSIDVTVVGGTSPYTYLWNDGNTNQDRTNITAGVYTVTVTDFNTCTTSISVTVSEPPAPVMTVTVTDATCFGANGSATANPVAGNGAFTFTWSAGSSTAQTVSLPQGNYTVTATDALLCNQTAAFTINQPADIVPNETLTHINCTGDATGAISFNPSGGNGAPYSYVWNPNVGTGNSASLLTAGSYNITITDQLNCPKAVSFVLNEPAQALTINIQSNNVSCFGLNNGSITITTTGGTPNYSYSWNPSVSTGNSATGLSPANYLITVSDFNNCSILANVTISEPNQPLTVTPSFTPLSCFQSNDGTATFTTTGGSFPYQYVWTPNVSTTNTASSLAAGLYSVVITDNNGCTTNSSTTVTQPTAITATESHSGIACAGDTGSVVTITPSGGTPGTTGYSFNWNPNVSNTNTATVNAGNYTVIVADSNNCTVSVAVSVTEPNLLTITSTFTNVTCFGANDATITGTAAGGTLPYGYSITQDGVNFTNSSTGFFGGVIPGTYTLLANDSNGCTVTMPVTITQPIQLTDNIVATDATCFGYTDGQVAVTGSGGTTPYTYALSNASTNTTGVFTGLAAGSYTTTTTDANGCTVTNTFTIAEPAELTIDAQPTPATIKLGESVQINTTTNQSGTVTYTWSPSFGLSCSDCANPLFEGIYSQTYTVVAVNAQGCSNSAQINVTVVPNYDIFFPNAFSPSNGDGNNDFWQIYGNLNAIKQINVMVFNRIGEKVFESNDIYFKWDGLYKGEPVQPNVYVYTAQIVWLNNHSDSKYKGTITVVK